MGDITPTPRATALVCFTIIEKEEGDTPRSIANKNWAKSQILKMIIDDWPEGGVEGVGGN